MARPEKPKRGRPVTIGAGVSIALRMPADLVASVTAAAAREQVSAAEWWRRAARERLERPAK